MKNLKKGFSLAELLIAIAIISVIAIMGTTIAKQNIERAFDLFVYTGFKGISDGITDAYAEGKASNTTDLKKHLLDVLSGSITEECEFLSHFAGTSFVFETPNNIRYYFATGNNLIKMEIPSIKKKNSNGTYSAKRVICLRYYDNPEAFMSLFPVQEFTAGDGYGLECTTSSEYGNIQDRKDLLPFYIDDGVSGTIVDGTYRPRTYYSFREAACSISSALTYDDLSALGIDCDGYSQDEELLGFLQVENPRKAF